MLTTNIFLTPFAFMPFTILLTPSDMTVVGAVVVGKNVLVTKLTRV